MTTSYFIYLIKKNLNRKKNFINNGILIILRIKIINFI